MKCEGLRLVPDEETNETLVPCENESFTHFHTVDRWLCRACIQRATDEFAFVETNILGDEKDNPQ